MSRESTDRQRRTADQYLEVGAQIIKDGLGTANTALPMLLGGLGVRSLSKAANRSTSTFYKGWDSVEGYTQDLMIKLLDESLASPEREKILYENLLHWPKRPDMDTISRSELVSQYTHNCATQIALDDPHLPVRWHTRPYITQEQVTKSKAFDMSKAALIFVRTWGIDEVSDAISPSPSGQWLLDMIDYQAFIEATP